jgi:beta-lactamase class A
MPPPPFTRPDSRTGAALAAIVVAACAPAPAAPSSGAVLERQLAGVAAASDGAVSVTVVNLHTGERASVGGQAPRPMMSVFKLPLAVAVLADVDRGSLRLDQRIPISVSELREHGPIAEAWKHGDKEPSLELMLKSMLEDSDNTAGDKLVTLLGGGAKITAHLHQLGLEGITIHGPEIARDAALACVGEPAPDGGWTLNEIAACKTPTAAALAAAVRSEVEAPPDNATTDAIVDLLGRLADSSILTGDSRTWLLSTLARAHTGPARLRGRLPPDARVAHKTGTGPTAQGVTVALGDVGIVTAPGGDAFAIAVLMAGSKASLETQEAVIARMARASWDAFVRK